MIEFKVRPVVRYIVTRYESTSDPATGSGSCGSTIVGEFANEQAACDVVEAFNALHPQPDPGPYRGI